MTLNRPLARLLGCLDVPLIVPVTLLAALVVGLLSGCGATNTQPSSNLPSPAKASPSAAAPLTDEQRAEEQAFDLWLAELILPITEYFGANALRCPKEGDKPNTNYYADSSVACDQWTFQVGSTGKVNGAPLSGAAMVTANPPATERYVTISWSCAGTVYTFHPNAPAVVRSGANSSAGTIERSQIRISDTSASISDADRANGITWQGKVFIEFIERLSYSAEAFSNVTPYEHPAKPPGVGQLTSYTDIRTEAYLALQNGTLVRYNFLTSGYNQIVPGERIFGFGTTGNPPQSDFGGLAQCVWGP